MCELHPSAEFLEDEFEPGGICLGCANDEPAEHLPIWQIHLAVVNRD